MMSLCSLAVYPPVSLRFSKLLERRIISTHNHLSLTNRTPQREVVPLAISDHALKPTVNFSRQGQDFLSKSSCLFNAGQTKLNLSVIIGDRQENRTTLSNLLASTNQSFLGSYSMTITVSRPQILQVFINFHGEQLRYNFVSHLIKAFERHEIKFFIDKDEQRGKDLKQLFVRIEESKIGLAIFSTRYSTSKWCMTELVRMKKRADAGKLTLIPLFHKVEPSDVSKPTRESEFGKNFWRLVEESDQSDPIQEWRKALEGTTNKMGLTIGDKSSEADFIEDIVKEVKIIMQAIKEEEE